MTLRVGREAEPCPGNRGSETDRGQDILKRASFACMVEHIVDGHHAKPCRRRQTRSLLDPEPVIAVMGRRRGKPDRVAETIAHEMEKSELVRSAGRKQGHHGKRHALAPFEKIVAIKCRRALVAFRAHVGPGQQPAQMAPTLPVPGIGDHVRRAVGEDEPAAGIKGKPDRFRLLRGLHVFRLAPRPHDTGDRVAVRDAHSRMAEKTCRNDQLFRARCTAQKGEVRPGGKFDIGGRLFPGHAKTPCTNQSGGSAVP